jgi:hypothetical protein
LEAEAVVKFGNFREAYSFHTKTLTFRESSFGAGNKRLMRKASGEILNFF